MTAYYWYVWSLCGRGEGEKGEGAGGDGGGQEGKRGEKEGEVRNDEGGGRSGMAEVIVLTVDPFKRVSAFH